MPTSPRALGGRPLIVRTLDAGGDKPLPYLALPPEDNPALGLRGVRLSLSRPELLAAQLRAILRASAAGDIMIMVPMIVDIAELRAVRAALDRAAADLGVDAVPLGVMVETPAAALLAGSLAAEADFLSIGTNDLSQYALAADRGNPATAARIDALHPAVLRLIAAVGEGARTTRQVVRHLRRRRLRSARLGDPDRSRRERIVGDARGHTRPQGHGARSSPGSVQGARRRRARSRYGRSRARPRRRCAFAGNEGSRLMRLRLDRLQPLGRALMLPIAVLPVAGLLLRLGQPDLLDIAVHRRRRQRDLLPARPASSRSASASASPARITAPPALAGAVAYLVTIEGAKSLLAVPPEVTAAFADQAGKDLAAAAFKARELAKLSVPAGILAGLIAGALYNRYATIRLPEYLAFFGGRRFVPIAAGFAGLGGALVFGLGFPWLEQGIDALSRAVVGAGPFGLFLYGVLNRLLIVTGLHHILNNIAWFILGDFEGATGDLQPLLRRRPECRRLHVGLLPGDDVRPARRLPRHVPLRRRPSAAARSAACCCRWR